jgi:hypothetical protein
MTPGCPTLVAQLRQGGNFDFETTSVTDRVCVPDFQPRILRLQVFLISVTIDPDSAHIVSSPSVRMFIYGANHIHL